MKTSKTLYSTSEINLRVRSSPQLNPRPRRYWVYNLIKWPFRLILSAYEWIMEFEPRPKRASRSWPFEGTRPPYQPEDSNPDQRTRPD